MYGLDLKNYQMIDKIHKHRYFDQASIEDLVKKYPYFEFEIIIIYTLEIIFITRSSHKISSYLSFDKDIVMYKDKPPIYPYFLDPWLMILIIY